MQEKQSQGGKFNSNEQQVEAIRNGDRQAFEAIYQNYFGAFSTYVQSKGGTATDARDVFQDAMYTAWLKVRTGKYQASANAKFSTYVFEIAKRKWWNESRTMYKQKIVHQEHNELPEGLLADGSKELLEERVHFLTNAMKEIDQNCQTILRLFYFEKMPYEKIAEKMGKTPQTVKSQKYRCMGRLRARLLEQLKHEQL